MSQLFDPLANARLIQQGADGLQGIGALALHAQQLQQQQQQQAFENQIRQADEQRRQQEYSRQVQEDQATRQYLGTQYSQYSPPPVPQGDEGDFFQQSPQQYQQAQQQFTQIDPRVQQQELNRARDDQTFDWVRKTQGFRLSEMGPAFRERYMQYAARKGINPLTNEFEPQDSIDSQVYAKEMGQFEGPVDYSRASPGVLQHLQGQQFQQKMYQTKRDAANPFAGVDPEVLSYHLSVVNDPTSDPADIAASQAWITAKTGKTSTPYGVMQQGREHLSQEQRTEWDRRNAITDNQLTARQGMREDRIDQRNMSKTQKPPNIDNDPEYKRLQATVTAWDREFKNQGGVGNIDGRNAALLNLHDSEDQLDAYMQAFAAKHPAQSQRAPAQATQMNRGIAAPTVRTGPVPTAGGGRDSLDALIDSLTPEQLQQILKNP